MCGEFTVLDDGTFPCYHVEFGIPIKGVKGVKTHSILVISWDWRYKRDDLEEENYSRRGQKKQFCYM